MPWHPDLGPRAAALAGDLESHDIDRLFEAVGAEAAARLDAMLAGIEAYRRHPYRRRLADPPTLWSEGSTRLLDFGATAARGARGPIVLFVPSLINRAYVLDLAKGHSMLRGLARRGLRPVLVEWGAPDAEERGFDLSDYILGRLGAALDRCAELAGAPVGLVGYCMGGNLALALAQHRQADLCCLALLATPWDFHAERAPQARLFADAAGTIDAVLHAFGELPVDLLQAFFAGLDPTLASRKFRAFARMAPESEAARQFVALEDWLNDGVPLAAAVARECLVGWYGENSPAKGTWRVGGRVVDPAAVVLPTLVVVPRSDRIVPPASARALAATLPGAEVLVPPSGHIGMVVGSKAREGLWKPLGDWLLSHLGKDRGGSRPARRRRRSR